MIPLIQKLWKAMLYDELAVRRWTRAGIFALGTGGLAYGNQLAEAVKLPGIVTTIKVASITCCLIAGAITAGEKNKEVPGEP